MTSDDLSGRILSHYQILKHLGSGGMGDVYLAHDSQLERTVALKILPAEVASDPERMRRFVREAKAASAIDHPNIVHVYEINQTENVNFISMQYVEGQTLRNKIDGRPLPIDELLQAAIQISDALTEAHARGIIHRDIKPANIMISSKGQVKLLDFGLARIDKITASSEDSQTETVSKTKSGIVIGTVAYMSPEQALGKGVDHRTDIFSTGIVLYEMATGQPPFSGQNPMETIDKILHHQPESIVRMNYGVP
jgi:eukaryotic-like serine/threonine-protein kinase